MFDLLYPPACAICGRWLHIDERDVCTPCDDDLEAPAVPDTPGQRPRWAAARFDGELRDALLGWKFRGQLWRARGLAAVAARRVHDLPAADVVVPVPLSWRRLVRRGHNVSAGLAAAVARSMGVPMVLSGLRRTRHDPPQSERTAAERAAIVGAFAAKPHLTSRRVLVVDDVSTTGHTADACMGALAAIGATPVGTLSLAFAPSWEERGEAPDAASVLDDCAPP